MAEAVVSFAVDRLKVLLISEAQFLYGVSAQVEEIGTELKRMQCFLQDADAKQGGDKRVLNWVHEIRQLAYQIEDVLEIYALDVSSKREGGFINFLARLACILCEGKAVHQAGTEILAIKAKLSDITSSFQKYGIRGLEQGGDSSSAITEVSRLSYSHLIERDFVGRNKDIVQVSSLLMSKENGCEVISVWGMGGIGKTTLVNKIYNQAEIKTHFNAFAWVCITQRLQRVKVLQSVFKQLVPERKDEISRMEDDELVQELYKIQIEKSCLVVLDDIWSVAAWEKLRPAFPVGDETSSSKILLTTRIRKVADVGIVHKLRPLSENEGLELLFKKAFPGKSNKSGERVVKPELEEIGRHMVRQCQGLPLAISTLGGALKGKMQREWEMISKDITSSLTRGDDDEDDKYTSVRSVLALSYDDLPPRLKRCFLYFGNFREHETISTDELYLLWIAEGIVSLEERAQGEMMMDVAERYLGELAERCLVQLEPTQPQDQGDAAWLMFQGCSLHDLVRDVCLSKGKDQNFINVIDFNRNQDISAEGDLSRKLYVRSLDNTTCTSSFVPFLQQQEQNSTPKLRSLLFFQADTYREELIDFPKDILNLQLLRLLKLSGFDMNNVGHAIRRIGGMMYLTYLSFEGCELQEIPQSIGNLRNLRTLDLRVEGSDIITIPNVLWKLKRLQHLYLPDDQYIAEKKLEELKFDGLSELELLYNFRTSVCDANDVSKLRKLQVFRGEIEVSASEVQGIVSFVSSQQMRYCYLKIGKYGEPFDSKLEGGDSPWRLLLECPFLHGFSIYTAGLGELPKEEYSFSQSITSMELAGCELKEDPMVILENMPNLRTLGLCGDSYKGKEMVCSATGFPKLEELFLYDLPKLEEWRVDRGAMRNLRAFTVTGCNELKIVPDGFKYLSTLQKLYIGDMPRAFGDRVQVRNGVQGLDFHKVSHIPTIQVLQPVDSD